MTKLQTKMRRLSALTNEIQELGAQQRRLRSQYRETPTELIRREHNATVDRKVALIERFKRQSVLVLKSA